MAARLAISALLLAALGCRDAAESPTEPALTVLHPSTAAVATLEFWQVSASWTHTCGVTTDHRAYCWGNNTWGGLGDGTTTQRFAPTAVAGGLSFRHVSAGNGHTCGVTMDYRAYCWGANALGQLGDGTSGNWQMRPAAVHGGHRFSQIEAGLDHTCGVEYLTQFAYCWGWNGFGQVGDGTTAIRRVPVRVAGARLFRQVSAGTVQTCGVTTSNVVFCWGGNEFGQLGDSTTVTRRLRPTRVVGARQYRQVDTGRYHTCAVTIGNAAYCWGNGRSGELGTGNTSSRSWPVKVSGALYFSRVSAGEMHSCGESTSKRAYCWGDNVSGELGDGTTIMRLKPVAVAGGHVFAQLTTGERYSCGKTTAGAALCWGENLEGQLGDGTTTTRLTPTPVAGGM